MIFESMCYKDMEVDTYRRRVKYNTL